MAAPKHSSEQFVKFFFTTSVVESRPTEWEIALHTGSPGAGDAQEVSSYSYQREDATFTASDKGSYWEAENDTDISFPVADTGESYTVTHYTVRDKTSGECLAIGEIPVPVQVEEGTIISFPAGRIQVRGV